MLTKRVRLISIGVLFFLSVGFLIAGQSVHIARAQAPTQSPTPACLSCHEDQYYMYDSGCWYCITEARDRCVNCHAGNGDSMNKQEAHIGLISNPLGNGPDNCKTCHAEDTEKLVQEVISHTGFHESHEVVSYINNVPVTDAFPEQYQSLSESQGRGWQIPTIIVVIAVCLALLVKIVWI